MSLNNIHPSSNNNLSRERSITSTNLKYECVTKLLKKGQGSSAGPVENSLSYLRMNYDVASA